MRRSIPARALAVAALAVAAGTTAITAAPGTPAAAAVPALRAASSADSEPGSIGVRLLDVPADLADDPRARQYVIDNLTPGTTIHRRIQVANKGSSRVHVQVYPDAADIAHGSFVGAAGSTRNDLTTWTSLGRTSLDIPAGAVADDTVTIAVPADAAPGERYAVVWAQVAAVHGTGGITLISRTGIRLYLCVGGENPPSAAFTVDTMTAERDAAGNPVVVAQVHNTGGRAVDLSGALSLSGVSGSLRAGPYRVRLGTSLAPGQSEPVTVPVTDQVANGPWNATIDLRSGLLDETARARITFPRTPGIAAAAVTVTPAPTAARPVLIGVLIGAVLLAGVMIPATALRRRRRTG